MVDKEVKELREWKEHPVTKKLFEILETRKKELTTVIMGGHLRMAKPRVLISSYNYAVGVVDSIEDLMSLKVFEPRAEVPKEEVKS